MARPVRLEFVGALYHVTARGDRREAIYEDDTDREKGDGGIFRLNRPRSHGHAGPRIAPVASEIHFLGAWIEWPRLSSQ